MLLSLTFLTGLAIGMYVYIVAFKPTYAPEKLGSSETEASEWSMVGKRRVEGDRSGYVQPTFRLLGDGQYVYLPGGMSDSVPVPIEGKLSRALIREVRANDQLVPNYARVVDLALCPGDRSGFDHEYQVTISGVIYWLDSCQTTLGHDTAYAFILAEVWNEIEGRREPTRRYESFSDWAQDWIRRNIGVE